ncbi:MAG: ribosome assembly cofactor RimP [Bacteroidales bacterium]|nr:ribosome assembly cofactor RimP [Bacteroidales bacterium]
MIESDRIKDLVDAKFEDTDMFLVELDIKPGNNIYIFIDGDSGVTISDCVQLSRYIRSNVDSEVEDYELHVSSAGLDKPLKLLRQFQKNLGKELEVDPVEGVPFKGTLIRVDENGVELEPVLSKKKKKKSEEETPQTIVLSFAEIKHAKVVIKF